MLCIDIGNKSTTVYDGKNRLTKLTTIKLSSEQQYQIGLPRSIKHVVYDIVALLGIKYQEEQFTRYAKFYFTDFWKNKWGKIDIGATYQQGFTTQNKCIITQTLLAMFLRKLLIQFQSLYNPNQSLSLLLSNTKFYITFSGQPNHTFRYALKQACEIAGIQSPVFIYSPHAIACSFYQQYCKKLTEIQDICVLEFGDRGTMVSVYRVHSYEDRIVEVMQCKGMKIGGYHLTKVLAEYIIQQIKQQKGIDISRHNSYMSLLHSQSESVKIISVQSQQKQAHLRIPDLPDDSTFGKIITNKLLQQILHTNIQKVKQYFKQTINKYKSIKNVIITGGSCATTGFQQSIRGIVGKNRNVFVMGKDDIGNGVFAMQREEITLFDVAEAKYEVIGEEGFHSNLMGVGEDVPERREVKAKFPAGQLQFNLRVLQNGQKIAHFLLDSRPTQPQFGLNFEIDRNKLISLHVKTQKGKIQLQANYQAIPPQQLVTQSKRVSDYKF